MSRFVDRWVARAIVLAAVAFAVGCVSANGNEPSRKGPAAPVPADAGSTGSGDTGSISPDSAAPLDGRSPDAMAAAPRSCREIRVCIFNCHDDVPCAARCVSSAPGPARQQYQQAHACSLQVCPNGETECRCNEECHGGGACFVTVDECDEAVSDPFCDSLCH